MSAAERIQQPRPVGQPQPAALQDTLGALPQDTTTALPIPSLRLGLATRPLPYPVDLLSRLPNPELQRPELRSRVRDWGSLWQEAVDRRLTAQLSELWLQSRPAAKGDELANQPDIQVAAVPSDAPPVQVEPRPPAPPDQAPTDTLVTAPPGPAEAGILPDAFSQYTDLGMIIQGRVELGGGWNRTRPCSVSIQLSCNARIIPDLQPDIQFGARVGGTISDRIHVSVDYDNRREFDAANNINVFYQGLTDEIIQRVEVGDVSFPLPQSRFLTQGIPAGNFGFRGTGQMGPLDFQMIWAQQKGDLGTREL